MTKEQKQIAVKIFKDNPQFPKLWMNPKGEFFSREDLAKDSLKEDEKLEVIEQKVSKVEPAKLPNEDKTEDKKVSILDGPIDKIKTSISEISEVEVLEQLLKDEAEGQNRKGAKEVLEAKITELKTEEQNGES